MEDSHELDLPVSPDKGPDRMHGRGAYINICEKRGESVTKRTCPWCGENNLILTNCMAGDIKGGRLYWEDRDCGYREVTYYDLDEFGYEPHASKIEGVYPVIRFHKPRAPLPAHQQPGYLRSGVKVVEVPDNQQTFEQVKA